MAAIDDPETVDLVLEAPDGTFLLAVAPTRPVTPADLSLLRRKIHLYVSFALDGAFAEAFPDAPGTVTAIHIHMSPPVHPTVAHEFERLGPVVAGYGLALTWDESTSETRPQ